MSHSRKAWPGLRLCIPTILFVGSQGRNLGIKGLELAQDKCNDELRRAFRFFKIAQYLKLVLQSFELLISMMGVIL